MSTIKSVSSSSAQISIERVDSSTSWNEDIFVDWYAWDGSTNNDLMDGGGQTVTIPQGNKESSGTGGSGNLKEKGRRDGNVGSLSNGSKYTNRHFRRPPQARKMMSSQKSVDVSVTVSNEINPIDQNRKGTPHVLALTASPDPPASDDMKPMDVETNL